MARIIDALRHPAWLITAVLLVFILLAGVVGGTGGWLASGGLATLMTGILAAAFYLGLIRASRFLRLTLDPEHADAIYASHPLGRVLMACGNYVGAGLVTIAVFG